MNKNDDKHISELMGDLKKSIIDLTKAKIAYSRARSKEITQNAIDKCKNTIYSSAKEAKINLETNSEKYEKTKSEIDTILSEYKISMEILGNAYEKMSKRNELKLTELYAKKSELMAEFHVLKDIKEEYTKENEKDIESQINPLKLEKEKLEKEAIEAIHNNDYEKSNELVEKCKKLKSDIDTIEENNSNKVNPYMDEINRNIHEHVINRKQIKELEALNEELEMRFKCACEESLENKEQSLAEVKNNKLFDKIKGFLSKSILGNVNKVQSFQKNTLTPLKNNVKKFTESIPSKTEFLKEKSISKFSDLKSKGKDLLKSTKEKVTEKAKNASIFVDDKIQDTKEGIYQASDYISGKTYQAIETAYNFGIDLQRKSRNSTISFLEKISEKANSKAQELKEKNDKIEKNKEKSL